MTNYQLGKIYKIVCNTTGLTYYGSTCEPTLARRLAGHVGKFKSFRGNGKAKFITSYNVLKNDDYAIILVELAPSNNKMELRQRERFYIENNECVNKNIPSRTDTEYSYDNREKINAYGIQYRLDNADIVAKHYFANKDHILETKAKYYAENIEEIKRKQLEYRANHKEETKIRNAEYHLKNKERIAQFKKDNKDLINARQKAYRLKKKQTKTSETDI
jgi:hypothetical protein